MHIYQSVFTSKYPFNETIQGLAISIMHLGVVYIPN